MFSLIKDIMVCCGIHICYMTSLELNPKTKGTVIRPNDKGEKIISWGSMKEFMITPLKLDKPFARELWKPKNWDINYPIVMLGSFGIYKCIGF